MDKANQLDAEIRAKNRKIANFVILSEVLCAAKDLGDPREVEALARR